MLVPRYTYIEIVAVVDDFKRIVGITASRSTLLISGFAKNELKAWHHVHSQIPPVRLQCFIHQDSDIATYLPAYFGILKPLQ